MPTRRQLPRARLPRRRPWRLLLLLLPAIRPLARSAIRRLARTLPPRRLLPLPRNNRPDAFSHVLVPSRDSGRDFFVPGPVGPGLRILLWGGTVFSVRHLNNKAPADFPSGLLPGTRGVPSCFGEKGIRTPETLLMFTRFPGGPVQPLLHLSEKRPQKYALFPDSANRSRFFSFGVCETDRRPDGSP